tara:strand:- start:11056 stop:11892 length:837 start_codon:yes stop_codon:yes gene_type:complete
MNLDELVPAPNAQKVNKIAKRVFGYSLDLENISETKAKKLHSNLQSQMILYESQLGSEAQKRTKYYEIKLALEALSKHINERMVDEEEVEENAFNTAREKAIADGKNSFSFNGKTYPITDKGKDDEERAKKRFGESEDIQVNEGAVETSELVMAAKSMVDKYDQMIKDLSEMANEDLAPVADKVRDEMGSDVADNFTQQMTQALESTLAVMKADRATAETATRVLVGDQPAEPMGDDPIIADEPDMEPTVDQDADDDFAAADAAMGGPEAEVGREKRD